MAPAGAPGAVEMAGGTSDKAWLTTLILAGVAGGFGVHRFYVGKIGTGIAMLLTFGGCGIWWVIDMVMILTNKFTDAQGRPLKK
jgi:TM2 domain-containing membrane protein YozV